jgi:hypothetical protein
MKCQKQRKLSNENFISYNYYAAKTPKKWEGWRRGGEPKKILETFDLKYI